MENSTKIVHANHIYSLFSTSDEALDFDRYIVIVGTVIASLHPEKGDFVFVKSITKVHPNASTPKKLRRVLIRDRSVEGRQ